MADQQSMQAVMQMLQQGGGQQGGSIPGNLNPMPVNGGGAGPGFGMTPQPVPMPGTPMPGTPMPGTPIPGSLVGGRELPGMTPPPGYNDRMPTYDPRDPSLSTSQQNTGNFAGILRSIMEQSNNSYGSNQSDFLNGLLSSLFGGPRPPATSMMPSQPGVTPRPVQPGRPNIPGIGNPIMRGPGFGMTPFPTQPGLPNIPGVGNPPRYNPAPFPTQPGLPDIPGIGNPIMRGPGFGMTGPGFGTRRPT